MFFLRISVDLLGVYVSSSAKYFLESFPRDYLGLFVKTTLINSSFVSIIVAKSLQLIF